MAKIKEVKYKNSQGEVFIHQFQYKCLGCGYEHAFSLERHQFNGDVNNPTVSPSLLQNWTPGKVCHSFIKDGKIQYLSDCSHHLAGQTIELPEIEAEEII